jgi:iron-sulfur cluster assembly accessory protein
MNITVTEKAVTEIKRIVADQKLEKVALRLRVQGGGCSGFQTKLDLDENFDETKENVLTISDIKVAVDKRSALYLEGATVDFHDGIDKRGFVVTNPAAKSTCGCGSSYSM